MLDRSGAVFANYSPYGANAVVLEGSHVGLVRSCVSRKSAKRERIMEKFMQIEEGLGRLG